VFAAVSQGLAWAAGAAEPPRVTKSSISGLRSKIGAAPMRELVERCCVPMADAQAHPHAFYAGLRLVAIDGSTFELPDEADNVAHFGYPGSRTGHAGYPQAQCVVLVECATHALLGAIVVRVVEYALPGLDDAQPRYRLLTTLLDPQIAPALELAALYHQRWEIEAVFDELKTHLRQSRRVLRSKTAELVRQEFYGWVL